MPKQPQKRGYMTIDALGSPAANSNSVIRADSSRASNPIKSKSTSEGVSSIRSEMSSVRSVGVRAQSCWSRFCAGIKSVLDAIYSCLARLPLIGSCFIKSSAPVEKTVASPKKIYNRQEPIIEVPVLDSTGTLFMEEKKQEGDKTKETNLKDFDITQAVIYSEILKRPAWFN